MKQLIFLLASVISSLAVSQIQPLGSYNYGLGTATCTSIDYNALRTNPSNLGWQSKFYKHQFSFKIYDLNGSLYSPVNVSFFKNNLLPFDEKLENLNNAFSEITESYEDNARFDTTFTLNERLSWSNALQNKTAIQYHTILFGASYVSPKYGTFAIQVSNDFFFQFQCSKDIADLFTLGKANPYFDSLVLSNGTVIPNNYPNLSNDTLNDVVHAWSTQPKTIGQMMNGTNITLLHTRYYSFGWGKTFKTIVPGWQTYLGSTLNFIQGRKMHDVRVINNEYYYRNTSAVNFNQSDFKQSPGAGASINLGLTLIKDDKWFIGASLNNLGFIRWHDTKNSEVSSYNSTTDFEVFDQTFGKSPTTSFFNQWFFMKLGIKDSKDFNDSVRFTTPTAANFSFGGKRIFNQYLTASGDFVLPINKYAIGNLQQPYVAAGIECDLKYIGITVGVNNHFSQFNLPFGLSFGSRKAKYSFTLSTYDLVNYFEKQNMQNITIAGSFVIRLN